MLRGREIRCVTLTESNWPGLTWHAMHLVYRLREHAPETGEDWVIEVSDETGARPLVVLPRAVPMLRATITPAELGGVPLKFGRGSR